MTSNYKLINIIELTYSMPYLIKNFEEKGSDSYKNKRLAFKHQVNADKQSERPSFPFRRN